MKVKKKIPCIMGITLARIKAKTSYGRVSTIGITITLPVPKN